MQPELSEERDDDVTKSRGRHDEAKVGPAESGRVTGKKADKKNDPCFDERVEEGSPEQREVVDVDVADLRHAAGEERIADGGGEHDGDQDGVLGRFEAVSHCD